MVIYEEGNGSVSSDWNHLRNKPSISMQGLPSILGRKSKRLNSGKFFCESRFYVYEMSVPSGNISKARLFVKESIWGPVQAQIWPSDVFLSKQLELMSSGSSVIKGLSDDFRTDGQCKKYKKLFCLKGKSVLELGTGCGLPSMVAALLGASCTSIVEDNILIHLRHNIDSFNSEYLHCTPVSYYALSKISSSCIVNGNLKSLRGAFDTILCVESLDCPTIRNKTLSNLLRLMSEETECLLVKIREEKDEWNIYKGKKKFVSIIENLFTISLVANDREIKEIVRQSECDLCPRRLLSSNSIRDIMEISDFFRHQGSCIEILSLKPKLPLESSTWADCCDAALKELTEDATKLEENRNVVCKTQLEGNGSPRPSFLTGFIESGNEFADSKLELHNTNCEISSKHKTSSVSQRPAGGSFTEEFCTQKSSSQANDKNRDSAVGTRSSLGSLHGKRTKEEQENFLQSYSSFTVQSGRPISLAPNRGKQIASGGKPTTVCAGAILFTHNSRSSRSLSEVHQTTDQAKITKNHSRSLPSASMTAKSINKITTNASEHGGSGEVHQSKKGATTARANTCAPRRTVDTDKSKAGLPRTSQQIRHGIKSALSSACAQANTNSSGRGCISTAITPKAVTRKDTSRSIPRMTAPKKLSTEQLNITCNLMTEAEAHYSTSPYNFNKGTGFKINKTEDSLLGMTNSDLVGEAHPNEEFALNAEISAIAPPKRKKPLFGVITMFLKGRSKRA